MAEKEYIERETLLRYLNDIWLSATPNDSMPDDDRHLAMVRCMGLNDAMDAVKSIPAADVRPVVTCGECKHWFENGTDYCSCDRDALLRERDFFCADGEKREES